VGAARPCGGGVDRWPDGDRTRPRDATAAGMRRRAGPQRAPGRLGGEPGLNAAAVILLSAMIGAAAGVAWAWLASGGYEANDSMAGTGFLGALAGTLAGAVLVTLRRRRR
jgi:hypothetical protein